MSNSKGYTPNLKPFTPEKAREAQLMGVKAKKKKFEARSILRDSILKVLCSKAPVADKVREQYELQAGVKLGKKEALGMVAMTKAILKAVKEDDWKALVELGRFAGMSFDQSEQGLGGADNPINVKQSTTIAPEDVKAISSELERDC